MQILSSKRHITNGWKYWMSKTQCTKKEAIRDIDKEFKTDLF